MSNKIKVSVLCITYNHEAYIRQALDGFLLQQTNFPIEVIVCDDASSDGTAAIIADYAKKYPKIIKAVLRKKNIGAIANSLDTLRRATGQYIALCEGDDYWTDPQKLQTQVDFLDKHPKYIGCFHTVRVVFDRTNDKEFIYPDVKDHSWYTIEELLKINYIPTNSAMYRRQQYDDMPTDVMPLDWFIHLYHARLGAIKFIDKTMSAYRKHAGGLFWEYDRNRDHIWRKFGLNYMAFYDSILTFYKDNPKRKEIIEQSIYTLLHTFVEVDKKYDEKLLVESLKRYPVLAESFVIYENELRQEVTQENELLKAQAQQSREEKEKLTGEVKSAGELRQALTEELDDIKRSKSWRLRAKAVNFIVRIKAVKK